MRGLFHPSPAAPVPRPPVVGEGGLYGVDDGSDQVSHRRRRHHPDGHPTPQNALLSWRRTQRRQYPHQGHGENHRRLQTERASGEGRFFYDSEFYAK